MEWIARISWADLLIVIIVVRTTYTGSQRGFFGELFHIFGICLAIVLGIHFYTPVSDFINTYLFIPLNIADIIGFLLVAITVYLVFSVIYAFLQKIIKIEVFPAINRIGGSLLGFCKGFVLSIFLVFIMLLTPMRYITESVKAKSLFAPFLVKSGAVLYEKSAGLFSAVKMEELGRLLKGAEPLRFDIFQFKKRDKLDQILQ